MLCQHCDQPAVFVFRNTYLCADHAREEYETIRTRMHKAHLVKLDELYSLVFNESEKYKNTIEALKYEMETSKL